MLIANAWHARSDAASSFVVAIGIGGNLMGYPLLDPIAALVVGLMIARMGWKFAWESMGDLMDRAISPEEYEAIHQTIKETPGVLGLHDMRTRRVGDLIIVDVHLELDAKLTVLEGHQIAHEASQRVLHRHPVLNVMTHVDPVLDGRLIGD
jgi:cation diffusion facilitator family transporter